MTSHAGGFALDFTVPFPDYRSARVMLSNAPMHAIAVDLADIIRDEAPSGRLRSPGETTQAAILMKAFCRDAIEQGLPATATFRDLRPSHLDEYERKRRARLPDGAKSTHNVLMRLRKLLSLAEERGLLDSAMKPRLGYTSLEPSGRAKPREAYSEHVHAQMLQAARAEAVVVAMEVEAGLKLPTTRHAFPFLVLLCLDPGLPVECIKELKDGCLRNDNGRYADLRYVKRRAQANEMSKRVKSGRLFTPGWLVSTYAAASAHLRSCAPEEDAAFLFLMWSDNGQFMSYMNDGLIDRQNAHFCERHAIVDDDLEPIAMLNLTRLRKTAKEHRYRDVLGNLTVFADDHSPGVAARHYASIPSLLPLHEATIEAGLRSALATRSTVVAEPDGPRPPADEEAPRDVDDVLTATCTDMKGSPFGLTDHGLCRVPVWGCLDCRCARIARPHLPGILAFLSFLEEKRAQMNRDDWGRAMGRAYTLINRDILPKFSPEDVEWARGIAAGDEDLKWLRNELQTLASR